MSWAAINPIITGWPSNTAPPKVSRLAADSKTWKKGQWGYVDGSGLIAPVAAGTGGSDEPFFRFCDDQTSSTSSTSVLVQEIMDGTEAIMWTTATASDGAIAQSNVGTKYGIYTKSNITYLDTDNTTTPDLLVTNLYSLIAPELHTIHAFNDAPGIAVVRYVA